jgi:hypothetical protein
MHPSPDLRTTEQALADNDAAAARAEAGGAPPLGAQVFYTMGRGDVSALARRTAGNPARAGEVYPATVVRVFDPAVSTANLQVHLDGPDSYWATSRTLNEVPGDTAGHWQWAGPSRAR